jgi:hypothetical protein
MKEWTGIEIERARQSLEHAAATILGRMIFAFSRLDVALALHLVWSNQGSRLEELTKEVEGLTFQKKLDFLQDLVTANYNDQEANSLYEQWLKDAHATRTMRNELVHGRWGTDPMMNKVVNVVGLPTSSEQTSKGYTIDELKSALDRMEKLQVRLAELREKWPV